MVELSNEAAENIELKLDEADKYAAENNARYTAEEVFGRLRKSENLFTANEILKI